jgi:ribosomal protein S18
MITQQDEWVIIGLTLDGEPFPAPDWAERLCDSLAQTGEDGHKTYSSYVRPVTSDGVRCVVVRSSLQGADFREYETLKRYVAENHLRVRPGRRDTEAAGSLPVTVKERRDPRRNIW